MSCGSWEELAIAMVALYGTIAALVLGIWAVVLIARWNSR